jgi:hypothetical protein
VAGKERLDVGAPDEELGNGSNTDLLDRESAQISVLTGFAHKFVICKST